MYNLNKQGKIDFFINHQRKLLSPKPNPLNGSFYGTTLSPTWVCATEQGMINRVVVKA